MVLITFIEVSWSWARIPFLIRDIRAEGFVGIMGAVASYMCKRKSNALLERHDEINISGAYLAHMYNRKRSLESR